MQSQWGSFCVLLVAWVRVKRVEGESGGRDTHEQHVCASPLFC